MKSFQASSGHFRITFSNGWGVSVAFTPGTYCENKLSYDMVASLEQESMDAEIAITKHGHVASHESFPEALLDICQTMNILTGDDVHGYVGPDDLLVLLNTLSSLGEAP